MVTPINQEIWTSLEPIAKALRLYHRHEVVGMDRLPKRGKALLIANHSLATYDMILLIHAVYLQTGRFVRPLVDKLFYKFPFLGQLMDAVGCQSGTKENARQLLENRNLVLIAPGGMREALRPSSEKYQTVWDKRKGFIRISIETNTPIILAICPRADDLYQVYPTKITKWMYKHLKIPFFLATGMGGTPLPKPVRLVHFLSAPIRPPKMSSDPEKFEQQVDEFHAKIAKISQDMLNNGGNSRHCLPAKKALKDREKF
jgi:1-acyl-sn-glycerol-3-phosphate acyltransferase